MKTAHKGTKIIYNLSDILHIQVPVQNKKMTAHFQFYFSPVQSPVQSMVKCVKTVLPVQYL